MLVYIRESDKENMMCNVDEKDIAEHLRVTSNFAMLSFSLHTQQTILNLLYNHSDKAEERTRRNGAEKEGDRRSTFI